MVCAYHRVARIPRDNSCLLFYQHPTNRQIRHDGGKKKEKVNFTDVEIRKLIELYSENKTALTAKQSNVITNKTKQETWRFIMESLNSCSDSGCHRTDGDIKKKWKDLLSRANKDVSSLKHHPTGGGPPPKTSPYSDIIVAIFGEDSPAFLGLDGVDSGCPQPPEQLEEGM